MPPIESLATEVNWPRLVVSPVSMVSGFHTPGLQPQPGSITPSQSLSRPSQVSFAGPVEPVQAPHIPLVQVRVPATQAPTSVPQGAVAAPVHVVVRQVPAEQMLEEQSASIAQSRPAAQG